MHIENIREALQEHLIPQSQPSRGDFHSVREEALANLAHVMGRPLVSVMIACLTDDIWPERFRPNRGTLTAHEQAQLLQSKVLVIGAGGLGGGVCTLLARIGVGQIRVCDGDVFDESNLNRQLLCKIKRLGKNKAICAQEEISQINPAVEVSPFPVWADEDNLPEIIGDAQVVVDCLDNLKARYIAANAAREANLPFVHAAIAGAEGMLLTVFPDDPGLERLYGPKPIEKSKSAETYLGVPTITPSAIACLEAAETVRILLGHTPSARGKMLHIDLSIPAIEANFLS